MGCVTLDKKLAIQTLTQVSDSQGGFTETWTTGVSVWGQIKPTKAYERFISQQNETPVSHDIIVRYRAGLNNKARFVYDARIFNIKEIINVEEASVYLKIKAVELL